MEHLRQYSYPQRTEVVAKVTHEYSTNCSAPSYVQDYFFIIAVGYTMIIAVWIMFVWYIYEEQSTIL